MSSDKYVYIFVFVSAVYTISLFFTKSSAKKDQQGNQIIRYNTFLRLISMLLSIAVVILIIHADFVSPIKDNKDLFLMILINLIIFSSTLILSIEFNRKIILIKKKGIIHYSVFGKKKAILWKNITKVKYHHLGQAFEFISISGIKFSINWMMPGCKELLKTLKNKIPPEKLKEAKEGFKVYGIK